MKKENSPKIYVGTYAKYSAGDMSGIWLEFSGTPFACAARVAEKLKTYHADERQPEFMVTAQENIPFTVPESLSAAGLEFLALLFTHEDSDILAAFLHLEPGEWPDFSEEKTILRIFDEFTENALEKFAGYLSDVPWTEYPDFSDWAFMRFLEENPGAVEYENYLDEEIIANSYACRFCEYAGMIFARH